MTRVRIGGTRHGGVLEIPREWLEWHPDGPPWDEAERAGWITACIEEGRARRAAGEGVPWLRHTTPTEARARLLEQRAAPAAVTARQRQVQLLARRPRP